MLIFNDKTLLITGDISRFGDAVLHRFLVSHIKELRIFSRDEKKQDEMRDLNYDQYIDPFVYRVNCGLYNSDNTKRLDLVGMKQMLLSLDYFQE